MESFLGYLFTIISEFQECLYCSITKNTIEGIQHHMKDKGHCRLNFDEGSEWQLFYEYTGSDLNVEVPESGRARLVGDELHLISGKALGHGSQTRHHRPDPQSQPSSSVSRAPNTADAIVALPITPPQSHKARTSQQLTTRSSDRLGMIGVSAQQQRALGAVQKMMLKHECRARDAYQAGVQKAANRQKSFRPDNPGRSNG